MIVKAELHNEWLMRSVILDHREGEVVFPGCTIQSMRRYEREIEWVIIRTGIVGSPFPIEGYVDDSLVNRFTNDTIYLHDGDTLTLNYTLSWYWYNDESDHVSLTPLPGYSLEFDLCLCA